MKPSTSLLFLAIVSLVYFSRFAAGQQALPYFKDDTLLVDATIQGVQATFLLDTGASFTSLFINGAERLKVETAPSPKINISGVGVKTSQSEKLSVSMFGKQITGRFAVLPFKHRFDGVLGWRDVPGTLYLDGYNRQVQAVDRIGSRKDWQVWELEKDNSQLFFTVTDGAKPFGRAFIDTGVTGGLRLSPLLWDQWKKQNPKRPTTLETFRYAVGPPMVSEVAWVDEYHLGDMVFRQLDIGLAPTAKNGTLTDAKGKNYVATIGMRAIRHMRLIVDHGSNELLTQPVPLIPPHNRLGAVFLPAVGGNQQLICRVQRNSPAVEYGLRDGDILKRVNGEEFKEEKRDSLDRLTYLFSQPAGTELEIRVRRNSEEMSVHVVLVDLLK